MSNRVMLSLSTIFCFLGAVFWAGGFLQNQTVLGRTLFPVNVSPTSLPQQVTINFLGECREKEIEEQLDGINQDMEEMRDALQEASLIFFRVQKVLAQDVGKLRRDVAGLKRVVARQPMAKAKGNGRGVKR